MIALFVKKIDRTNNFKQAGERYRTFEDWEREDHISNLVGALTPAAKVIQDKMIDLFTKCDADYGQRVADGIKKATATMSENGKTTTKGVEDRNKEGVQLAEEMATEARPY